MKRLALLLPLLFAQALSGDRTNIQGVGMARTGVAISRGIDAVGINPANLAVPEDALLTLALLPSTAHVGNNVLSYDFYTKYFTGMETDSGRVGVNLSNADKEEILKQFSGGVGDALFDLEVRPIGLRLELGDLGAFALTMSERISGAVSLPEQMARFLFFGNPPGSEFDLSQSHAEMVWTREYALSYARSLPTLPFLRTLQVGASLKLIHGLSYFKMEQFDAYLHTSPIGVLNGQIDVFTRSAGYDPTSEKFGETFKAFPAPAGLGYGLDLGVAAEVTDMLRLGLSITDIGSIDWKRENRENVTHGSIRLDNPLDPTQKDSLDNALRGESREGSPFSTSLPTSLNLGAAFDLKALPFVRRLILGELTVAADLHQGLIRSASGSVLTRGSLAFEYRPVWFLPIRSGVSVGGAEGTTFAVGLGFHFGVFDLDLAAENVGWIVVPSSARDGSLAMGMRVRI
jgi:hypothetical protein